MANLSNLVRHEGDPRILRSGPSSMSMFDHVARSLGWFSIGLGLFQLFAPGRLTRALGTEGAERLLQAIGLREIGSGVLTLSVDKEVGLWSRMAGDGIDLAALVSAHRPENPKRDNVGLALAMVAGIMLLDTLTAQRLRAQHGRGNGMQRDYRDRSGFPHGVQHARGAMHRRDDRARAFAREPASYPVRGL